MATITLTARQAKRVLATANRFWRNTKSPGTTKRGIQRSAVDVLSVIVHLSQLGECVPSLAYLAKRTSYSKSTVLRALRDLRACGLFHIQKRRKQTPVGTRQAFNRYTVLSQATPRVPFGIDLSLMFRRQPPQRRMSQGVSGAQEYRQEIITIERKVSHYSRSLLSSLRQQRQYA
jgi:hypothetical protein